MKIFKKDKLIKKKKLLLFTENIQNQKKQISQIKEEADQMSDLHCYSYHSHPKLKLGGGVVSGGSCLNPPPDCDIYVSLDHGVGITDIDYPWKKLNSQHVRFFIDDFSIPKDPDNFKEMIYWLKDQLSAGKRIHVGCLGGHGRTGMVLSALVCVVNQDKNAIQTVRNKYCSSAVETSQQEKFLSTLFNINLPPQEPEFYDLPIIENETPVTHASDLLSDKNKSDNSLETDAKDSNNNNNNNQTPVSNLGLSKINKRSLN